MTNGQTAANTAIRAFRGHSFWFNNRKSFSQTRRLHSSFRCRCCRTARSWERWRNVKVAPGDPVKSFLFPSPFEPGNTARRLRAPTLVRHVFTRFRKAVRTVTPVRDLLRGVLAYKVAESLYFSFSLAFAYLHHGFIGCLIFFGLQSAGIAVGYYGGLTLFARAPTRARHSLQWAGLVWAASLTATGCFTGTAASAMLLSGSIFGGAAIAVKQWHELTRTSGAVRESYLLLAHSAGSLIRIASLACAAIFWPAYTEKPICST